VQDGLIQIPTEMAAGIGHPRSVLLLATEACGSEAKAGGARVVGVGPDFSKERQSYLDEAFAAPVTDERWHEPLQGQRFDLLVLGEAALGSPDVLARAIQLLEDGGHVVAPCAGEAGEPAGALARAGLEVLWSTGPRPRFVRAAAAAMRAALDARDDKPGRVGKLLSAGLSQPAGEAPSAPCGVVVARVRPVSRKLSLTVGMISMNEELAVGGVIDDIRRHVPDAEILLVDSSKDKTPEIAEARGARVERQFPPRGYGPAMHRLLYEARTDVMVTIDCDGTYPADRIAGMHALIEEGFDLVNATRTRQRPQAMPFPNYLANRTFAAAADAIHGLPTTDLHSGMRAYRMSMLRGISFDAKGAALPVDLLVMPARRQYRVVEVEIPYSERLGATTLHRFDSTMWTFRRLFGAAASGGVRTRAERYLVR
jgi:hypothetical protein